MAASAIYSGSVLPACTAVSLFVMSRRKVNSTDVLAAGKRH